MPRSARTVSFTLLCVLLACARTPQKHEVAIRDFKFQPDTLLLQVGDSVVWRNYDFAPHTATADDRGWDSGSIAPNTSWSTALLTIGPHPYLCALHPNMRGVIILE